MKFWCYNFPCRFQTGQLSFEVIVIDSVCQSFLKKNFILWIVDTSHDLPSILVIWTIISHLLQIVFLKVLCTPNIFSSCEYTFETYKEDIPYKQFIQRSTPRGRGFLLPTIILIICVYSSQINFNWSKSEPILNSLALVVSKTAELFQKNFFTQSDIGI